MQLTRRAIVSSVLVTGVVAGGLVLGTAVGGPDREAPGSGTATTVSTATASTVLVVSVDGLNPRVLPELGRSGAPTLHRLVAEGAATLNARTEREQTNTLPNHTGMVTGRRINASSGGHGVTWNDERLRPGTVQAAAGHAVGSIFSAVDAAGGSAALFAGKEKFGIFERSWPAGVDLYVLRDHNARLVRRVRTDLVERERALRFVHLSKPDLVGHAHGFMSQRYVDAVAAVDHLLATLLATIESDRELSVGLTLVLTADHGGRGPGHSDPTALANYRVPFLVWGAGVTSGADLYDLNPDYQDPGNRRSRYSWDRQPVRNGAVANLALDLLGLPAIRGSEHNVGQDLDVGSAG